MSCLKTEEDRDLCVIFSLTHGWSLVDDYDSDLANMLVWIRADRACLNSLSMAHLLLWSCAKSITGVLTISKTACKTLRSFYEENQILQPKLYLIYACCISNFRNSLFLDGFL